MNKYLIAFTKYKHYFSTELETGTYCVKAENMNEAVKKLKYVESVYEIIAISKLDDSITWEDLE
jgi:VCBS repeat-containing protein